MPTFGKRHLGHATIIRAGGQPAVGRALIRTKAARDASGFAHRPLFQAIIKRIEAFQPPPQMGVIIAVTKIALARATRPAHRYRPMMTTFHPSGTQVIRWWIKT